MYTNMLGWKIASCTREIRRHLWENNVFVTLAKEGAKYIFVTDTGIVGTNIYRVDGCSLDYWLKLAKDAVNKEK